MSVWSQSIIWRANILNKGKIQFLANFVNY